MDRAYNSFFLLHFYFHQFLNAKKYTHYYVMCIILIGHSIAKKFLFISVRNWPTWIFVLPSSNFARWVQTFASKWLKGEQNLREQIKVAATMLAISNPITRWSFEGVRVGSRHGRNPTTIRADAPGFRNGLPLTVDVGGRGRWSGHPDLIAAALTPRAAHFCPCRFQQSR